MASIFDTKLLSCGLGGRPGKDGKCKKPMKKGPPTSPLTVPQVNQDKKPNLRVSPVSFEKRGGTRRRKKTKCRRKNKRKKKTKRRRKKKKKTRRRR